MNLLQNEYEQTDSHQKNKLNSEKILEDKYLDGSLEFSPYNNIPEFEAN